ncbi:hypothetical protein V6N11_063350 [Hibiscus sabdariffa]|uniref:Ty3 transposon capsid-like protein domain-containing protein n=2 Tax=Hibiscus sabdariffa TaxID=183260 RepID=A0ABR2C199_9ROSI
MSTTREWIENLETSLGSVQDQLHRLETNITDKIQQLENAVSKATDALLSKQEPTSSHVNSSTGLFQQAKEESRGSGHSLSFVQPTKLKFLKYAGDDPTEWFTRSYMTDDKEITWEIFVEELWARFGPTDCEDFHEALSKIKQVGSLHDYQKEFERLGNRVQRWSQKALVGTFMGGLKDDIADAIRMFKPKTLKDAISLARMREEQLTRQRKLQRPTRFGTESSLPTKPNTILPMKRLTWSEMQKRRAQGLCFNCDEKFTTGHRCCGSQLLILEGIDNSYGEEVIEDTLELQPEISLHALSAKRWRQCYNYLSFFNVKVANGEPLQCQGRFENLPVDIQGINFVLTLYALPLRGLDLVLGVHWLEQLGTVVCNWKQLTMEFQWNNETQITRPGYNNNSTIDNESYCQGSTTRRVYACPYSTFYY